MSAMRAHMGAGASDFTYRVLLRVFPRSFRLEYGGEMVRLFRERSARFDSDPRTRRRFLVSAFRDVLVHGILERAHRARAVLVGLFSWEHLRRQAPPTTRRSSSLMHAMQDIRHAVRNLASRPGLSLVIVTTMAVGIGGNAAIFSVLNSILLKGLPFHEPQQLVTLDVRAHTGFLISTSIPNYVDWRDRNRSFESFGAAAGWTMTYTGGSRAQVVSGRLILGEFFETLGVEALLGRTISAQETDLGAAQLAVLDYRFWQREFGGDSAVVGRSLTLDGQPTLVVGVMPQSFGYPSTTTDIYIPMGVIADLPWENRQSAFGARSIARLAPGITVAAAMSDMERVGREVRAEFGETVATPEVRPLDEFYVGEVGSLLWILMGAVGFVLLIAIANIGNLLLVRGEGRRAELAVRTALGASRAVVVRHLVTEGMVLAIAGGLAGLVVARLMMPALIGVLPATTPVALTERIAMDWGVLGFIAVLLAASGVMFGLLPAFRLSQLSPVEALRTMNRSADTGGKRLRTTIVTIEIAVATVLLIAAGLMIESLVRLGTAEKGFQEQDVLTARVRRQFPDSNAWRNFYVSLLDRARALPGVTNASVTLLLPLTDRSWELRIWPEGVPAETETGQSVLFGVASTEYFNTLGIPLVSGRFFTTEDRAGTEPVAIIDETMADRFWPDEDPIGKRVTFELDASSTSGEPVRFYRTVVGVTQNVRHYELDSPSRIQVYVPFMQMGRRCCMDLYVVLKTDVAPSSLTASVQRVAAELDPDAALSDVQSMQTYVDAELSDRRAVGNVLVIFGAVAIVLASMGVFGIISYSVSRQTREIGLRVALGARHRDIVRWFAGSGLTIGLLGAGIGLALAAALARVLSGLLYQVSPVQPSIYLVLGMAVAALSTGAAYLPARRAARVDPVRSLKQE